jgi:hypothetical protein
MAFQSRKEHSLAAVGYRHAGGSENVEISERAMALAHHTRMAVRPKKVSNLYAQELEARPPIQRQ